MRLATLRKLAQHCENFPTPEIDTRIEALIKVARFASAKASSFRNVWGFTSGKVASVPLVRGRLKVQPDPVTSGAETVARVDSLVRTGRTVRTDRGLCVRLLLH